MWFFQDIWLVIVKNSLNIGMGKNQSHLIIGRVRTYRHKKKIIVVWAQMKEKELKKLSAKHVKVKFFIGSYINYSN